jgi:hypothetical protein
MRLFRQRVLGDWTDVFARLAEELRGLVAKSVRRPLLIDVSPGEFLDRLIACEVECAHPGDPVRLARRRAQLATLQAIHAEAFPDCAELAHFSGALREVHEALREFNERATDDIPINEWYALQQRRIDLQRAADDVLGADNRKPASSTPVP